MLDYLGFKSLDEMIDNTVPKGIRRPVSPPPAPHS